jgi:hypothetical protein
MPPEFINNPVKNDREVDLPVNPEFFIVVA